MTHTPAAKFYELVCDNRRTDAGAELSRMVTDLLDDVDFDQLLTKIDCYAPDLSAPAFKLYRKLISKAGAAA